VVAARRQALLDALVEEIVEDGGRATALAGDVTDEDYAAALVACAVDNYGGLDIAFNNVGQISPTGATEEISLDAWRRPLDINLTGPLLAANPRVPPSLDRAGGWLLSPSTLSATR